MLGLQYVQLRVLNLIVFSVFIVVYTICGGSNLQRARWKTLGTKIGGTVYTICTVNKRIGAHCAMICHHFGWNAAIIGSLDICSGTSKRYHLGLQCKGVLRVVRLPRRLLHCSSPVIYCSSIRTLQAHAYFATIHIIGSILFENTEQECSVPQSWQLGPQIEQMSS